MDRSVVLSIKQSVFQYCLSSWRYWLDDSKGIRPEKSWVLIFWWWRLEQSLTRSRSSCCHYCHLATWIELNTSQKFLFLPPPSSLAPAKSTVTVWLSGTTAYPYCPGNWKRVDTCYYSFLVQLGVEGWVGLQSIRRAQFLGSASNERPLIESESHTETERVYCCSNCKWTCEIHVNENTNITGRLPERHKPSCWPPIVVNNILLTRAILITKKTTRTKMIDIRLLKLKLELKYSKTKTI